MSDTTQEVTKEVITTGKTILSFKEPTPIWATHIFRGTYIAVTVFGTWLAATHLIADTNKFELLLGATAIDRTIWLFARSIGVKKTDIMPDEEVTN